MPVSTVFIIVHTGEFIKSVSRLCSFPSTGEVSTIIFTIFCSVSLVKITFPVYTLPLVTAKVPMRNAFTAHAHWE